MAIARSGSPDPRSGGGAPGCAPPPLCLESTARGARARERDGRPRPASPPQVPAAARDHAASSSAGSCSASSRSSSSRSSSSPPPRRCRATPPGPSSAGPRRPTRWRALREQLHLGEPVLQQYWHWLSGFLHGDLGNSLAAQQPVSEVLGKRLQNSVALVALAAIISTPLSIALGAYSAARRDRPFDHALGRGHARPRRPPRVRDRDRARRPARHDGLHGAAGGLDHPAGRQSVVASEGARAPDIDIGHRRLHRTRPGSCAPRWWRCWRATTSRWRG